MAVNGDSDQGAETVEGPEPGLNERVGHTENQHPVGRDADQEAGAVEGPELGLKERAMPTENHHRVSHDDAGIRTAPNYRPMPLRLPFLSVLCAAILATLVVTALAFKSLPVENSFNRRDPDVGNSYNETSQSPDSPERLHHRDTPATSNYIRTYSREPWTTGIFADMAYRKNPNVIHHLAAIMACPPLFPSRRDLLTQLLHDTTTT